MSVASEPLLLAYKAATAAFAPFAPLLLDWRLRRGKEDGARRRERLGRAGLPRPDGRLAWLHGASVGELLAALPLIERLVSRGLQVLVTTGTVSSARILAARLPSGAMHQFAPLDTPPFVGRFLDHWRPDLALFAELELWPNAICALHARKIPLALVNARLSGRSFRRWRLLPRTIAALLARFDLILAQSRQDGARLAELGAPQVRVAGNLKYDAPPPPADPEKLARLAAAVGARPVWLAASTHPAEDSVVLETHVRLARARPEVLTIIAPRHAPRGPEIAAAAKAQGLTVALRSRGEPVARDIQVYVADTMGEMGLFYRIAGVVFVGKSLNGAGGGQNPIEPAKLGAAVLHGPDVANFAQAYQALDEARGAALVGDSETLARMLAKLFADPAAARRMARAAAAAVEPFTGATDAVMRSLEPYLAQMQVESQ